jgi:hypothetical protein
LFVAVGTSHLCYEEISDHPMTSASAAEQTEGNYFREGLRRLDREELPERRLGDRPACCGTSPISAPKTKEN